MKLIAAIILVIGLTYYFWNEWKIEKSKHL
jgi:hypothetical protein